MPSFDTSNKGARTPFGKNEYRRSTKGLVYESYTVAASTIPEETVDSVATKVLQSGELMAKITSGGDAGKIGPFVGALGNEVVTLTEGTNITAGTFTLTFDGETTAAIQHDATASAIQTALEALSNINPGDVVVTGGILTTNPVVITFGGQYAGENVPAITSAQGSLTGTFTIGTVAGGEQSTVTDGREDPANIVGVNDTFLPWQLTERDVEVSICQEGTLVQAWCFQRDPTTPFARAVLSDATVAAVEANPLTRKLRFV